MVILDKLKELYWRLGLNKNFLLNNFYYWLNKVKQKKIQKIYNQTKNKNISFINIDNFRLYLDPQDRGITPSLLTNSFEKYQTAFFKKILKNNFVIVDIGASVGYYSLIAAKFIGPNGRVYSFEPCSVSYDLLCKNIKYNNFKNITPIKKAVSNKTDQVRFWTDKAGRAISSLSKENTLFFKQSTEPVKYEFFEINTVSLDDFLKNIVKDLKIDVIKIDAQGAEGLVIDGASNILNKNLDIRIFMEFWPHGLKNLGTNPILLLKKIRSSGFSIALIDEKQNKLETLSNLNFFKNCASSQEFNLFLSR